MDRLKQAIEQAENSFSEVTVGTLTLPIDLVKAYNAATEQLKKVIYVDLLNDVAVKAILAMKWHDFTGSVENSINIWDGKASVYANKHIMVIDLLRTFGMPVSPGYVDNE